MISTFEHPTTGTSTAQSMKHRCRYIFPIIISILLLALIIFMVLWVMELKATPKNSNKALLSSSSRWNKNSNFVIKPSNGRTFVALSNDGTRFTQCSNDVDIFNGFIEINDVLPSAEGSSFYLSWDIPNSLSQCDMSGDGSIALWTYINHDSNNVEMSVCSINSPFVCIKELVGSNNSNLKITSVSSSKNGFRIAVGIQNQNQNSNDRSNGFVRMYTFDGKSLARLGNDIFGESGMSTVNSVSISESGDAVAMGYLTHDEEDFGQVNVFMYIPASNSWERRGDILTGINGDLFGISISLASRGDLIAVGANGHLVKSTNAEMNNTETFKSIVNAGKCQVFHLEGNTWKQLGSTILGAVQNEYLGSIVKLSGNGKRLFVSSSRHIKVFDWILQDGYNEKDWTRAGWFSYETAITQISTTFDGRRVAIGAFDVAEVYDDY